MAADCQCSKSGWHKAVHAYAPVYFLTHSSYTAVGAAWIQNPKQWPSSNNFMLLSVLAYPSEQQTKVCACGVSGREG